MHKSTKILISLFFLYSSFLKSDVGSQKLFREPSLESTECKDQPLLVVTIMVKNEAAVMEATLKPFLEAGLQHYLILDTGSTDKTVSVVRDLFKKYKVKYGYIAEQPFVNFAVSRNYALEQAEKFFSHAIFFLMIDAEWYMHNVEGLLEFCKKNQNHESKAFLIRRFFPSDKGTDYVNWLFRAHQGIRFYGAVHEHINQFSDVQAPDNIFITIDPSRCGNKKSALRWKRDLDLLFKEHEKYPDCVRTIFFLGQTCACLQQYEQAIYWYKKVCKDKRDFEEKYQACYRIALLYQALGKWSQALIFYFKAYAMRSQRIDSLVRIAQYFLSIQDYCAAFILAKYIAAIPAPTGEKLLLLPELYDFTRYEILAKAAWHVGEFEIGRRATLKALDYDSSRSSMKQLLLLYERALNHYSCDILDRTAWCPWCHGSLWLSRPAWFNVCCLSGEFYRSNRCNFSHGITWRSWIAPFIMSSQA